MTLATPFVALLLTQSPALQDAVREHAAGAWEMAQRELASCERAHCPRQAELSLLCGTLALAEGEPAAAEKHLRAHGAPAGLPAYHAYYLAQSHFYQRKYSLAARGFENALALAPASLKRRWEHRWAEAELRGGRPAHFLATFGLSDASDLPLDTLLARAEAYTALGSRPAAAKDWRAFLLRAPAHATVPDVVIRLSGDPKKPLRWSFEELLVRGARLLAASQAASALREADAARQKAQNPTHRARLALLRAEILFALDRDTDAKAALNAAKAGPKTLALEARMFEARRVLKGDDRIAAQKQFAEIARQHPRTGAGEEAAYLAGWLLYQLDRFPEAAVALAAYAKRYPDSRMNPDALWFRGLALLHASQPAEARAAWLELMRESPLSPIVPQARYWAARALESTQAEAMSWQSEYNDIVRLFPGTLYGVFAAARLESSGAQQRPLFPKPPALASQEPPATHPEWRLAQSLAAAGLFRDATDLLSSVTGRIRNTQEALVFGAALVRVGEFGLAHALAARVLWGEAYAQASPEALALMYPRAYTRAVVSASTRAGVDAHLMWALMRRESGFAPEVSSSADARGLLQLMPNTARRVAAELGKPSPHPDALFAPALNIELATAYVGALTKRFAHPAFVAAAYNAGPAALLRWISARGTEPLDLFIEDIPYKETRLYVKQVLADHYLYRLFYEGHKPAFAAWNLPTPGKGVEY
ncbi:MAG: transglycosylase SLT domain-containing protein [Myxococcaceae bacterium]